MSEPTQPPSEYTRYFIVGLRPVKMIRTADGRLDVLAFGWNTGEFTRGLEYLARLVIADDEVNEVGAAEFEEAVAQLRATGRQQGRYPPVPS